ncbi:Outer membrane efflux protein [Pseudobythopirellula maris]|uniref:Outer membrane efflux protein n=1 Tax=Pseudobythopirellula maris TaxID=2527991 RepID=A0A5C5ZPC3_9BACT|nr:TolC family protein [Pseudobythopirellula maris]TWT88965.1 Outer membrane efflux protein [Pseudobythopirellula maris]
MERQNRAFWSIVLSAALLSTGCQPTQPFFFMEDGDLSHYMDVATTIDYPDVEEASLDEVSGAMAPLTLKSPTDYEMWDLTLEEATRITLCNSQVMRQLGGTVVENAPETISRTLVSSVSVNTTYDPALVESATGTSFGSPFSGSGVEAALSEFDAQLDSSVSWNRNDRPVNTGFLAAFAPTFQQDLGNFSTGVSKTSATGAQYSFRNNTNYDFNSNLIQQGAPAASEWGTNFEAFIRQPLLQGAGAQYNRIAGPFDFNQYASNGVNAFDGVVLARIRNDQSLADFEGGVRNLMRDVEQSYWSLYFAYRDLDARKLGRDSALATWKKVAALYREGARGGSADREAQARSQYFQFKAQVEQGLTALYASETRLRYLMGLAVSDGRLIRPADEPTAAPVAYEWGSVHGEALVRRVEVRKQKWEIKKRELELIAARNHLLPRLDAFGTYRWLGAGDRLYDDSPVAGTNPFRNGSGAFNVLTDGDFEEWELGVQLSVPIGFRKQLSTVRHHQLLLARDRAILQDLELEVSHQLGDAIRDLDLNYGLTETNFNRRVAAQQEVEAVQASYDANRATLDLLLDAQRRRAEAETSYYRSIVDYNIAISDVHYRKGSLLDYNGVFLAEGPWPGKAYFDAMRRARQRDASMYLDYGFTRPNVFSRGPVSQGATPSGSSKIESVPSGYPTPADGEIIVPHGMTQTAAPINVVDGAASGRAYYATPEEASRAAAQPVSTAITPVGYEAIEINTTPGAPRAEHASGQPTAGQQAQQAQQALYLRSEHERREPGNPAAEAPAVAAGWSGAKR